MRTSKRYEWILWKKVLINFDILMYAKFEGDHRSHLQKNLSKVKNGFNEVELVDLLRDKAIDGLETEASQS